MKKQLDSLRRNVRERITKLVYAKRDEDLQKKMILAEARFKAAQKTEAELRGELQRTQKKAAEVSRLILLGQEMEKEMERLNTSHEIINKRMRNLRADSRAPGRVSLESYAEKPHNPTTSNRKKVLAAAILFSFGWITATCFAFDLLDNRIRSPKELETALGFVPTWPISHLNKGNFYRVTLDYTGTIQDKAIRSLAVRLDKERKKHKARLAVFTGVDTQSGVSEIVLNTAHAMRGTCEKVLIIELNLYSPILEGLLGVPDNILGIEGLSEGRPFEECAFFEKERGVHVLTANKKIKVDNAKIGALLETFATQFDFILIDSAPVLRSDLTEFLIGMANVGVLIVHGDHSLYRETRHATEILCRLELPALAAVLNWKRRNLRT